MNYELISPRNETLTVLEQVLNNRGISPDKTRHYLNTTDSDILDPAIITNIREGAKMLVSHIAQGHKIFI